MSPSVCWSPNALAARSHLVAQQHDDHVLLGVLVDLRQPGLDTERKSTDDEGTADKREGRAEGKLRIGRRWMDGCRENLAGCRSSRLLPSSLRNPLGPSTLFLHLHPSSPDPVSDSRLLNPNQTVLRTVLQELLTKERSNHDLGAGKHQWVPSELTLPTSYCAHKHH